MSSETPDPIEAMEKKAGSEEVDREALEREAGRVRARLLARIDVLEHRMHEVLDVKHQVETHLVPIAAGGAIVFVGLGAALALAIFHAFDKRHHRTRARMRAFRRLWAHPERAGSYQPKSVLAEVGRKALVAGLSLVAVELTKRGVRSMMAAAQAREAVGAR